MKKITTMALASVMALGLCAGCDMNSSSKDTSNSNSSSNVESNVTTSTGYKYSDIIGAYKASGTKESDIEGNKVTDTYTITFYDDATYDYSHGVMAPGGHVGTYTVDGDKITLYPIYETGSDTSLTASNIEKIEISISSKDEITSSTLADGDATTFKRTSESEANSKMIDRIKSNS